MSISMTIKALNLDEKLYRYLLSVSFRETDLLQKLRVETRALPEFNMQITPEQGQFLGLLAKIVGAKKVLEVGVFTGYSSLSILMALPAEGRLVACDLSEEWTAMAERYWTLAGVRHQVDLRLGLALDTLNQLITDGESATFDMAFIDADKSHYRDYYEAALRLVRPGGLIVIDNLLWSGKVADPKVSDPDTLAIRDLNDRLHRDERIDYSLIPMADGIGIARVREQS
jgi:caffeoyl-CoA O-methyltransferase